MERNKMETEVEIGKSLIEVIKGNPKETKKKWGSWIIKDNLTLVHVGYKSYEIDLEKMSREEMLDWICHLSGKGHISPRDLGFFVYACEDIFETNSRYTKDPYALFTINDEYLKGANK